MGTPQVTPHVQFPKLLKEFEFNIVIYTHSCLVQYMKFQL